MCFEEIGFDWLCFFVVRNNPKISYYLYMQIHTPISAL